MKAFRFGQSSFTIAVGLVVFTILAVGDDDAAAKPEAPSILCQNMPDSGACAGWVPTCEACHYSTQPVSWNPFGIALITLMPQTGTFEERLTAAVQGLDAAADSDGDGHSDLVELDMQSNPGLATSFPAPPRVPVGTEENPRYDVGNYDMAFAYKRINLLYCGVAPSYDDMQAFEAAGDQAAALHTRLDLCLDTDYWRRVALPRLADKRVRPISAVQNLSDYTWDYDLWEYVLTDDRDAREMLTAQYHVQREVDGTLSKVQGVIPDTMAGIDGQGLEPQYRAGLLTTQWFLLINTMFSAMPRTTAAQAYRAFLGMDIARNQGIWPAPDTLVDVDYKGITQDACAVCHTTLDFLSYPFVNYHGLTGPIGRYDANRAANLIPQPVTEQGYLFGQPVNGLLEWAAVASNSDAFKRNLTNIFWAQALDRAALPHQQDQFRALWSGLAANGHSVDQLIHDLVDTDAFGAP